MREILFRGKVVREAKHRPGEWVFGDLATYYHYHGWTITEKIISGDKSRVYCYLVEPSSVGQFTGFRDAEGQLLFDGDILLPMPNSKDIDESEYRILWDIDSGCWSIVENRTGAFFDWLTIDNADKFVAVQDK